MRIEDFQLAGIRCFDDTGRIEVGPKCNIFVGLNNSGKTTILKSMVAFQGPTFTPADIRAGAAGSHFHTMHVSIRSTDVLPNRMGVADGTIDILRGIDPGTGRVRLQQWVQPLQAGASVFFAQFPQNCIVPFLAGRKAPSFDQNVNTAVQSKVSGTFHNLYSRLDLIVTEGHPQHQQFIKARNEIIGLPITTKASEQGKVGGFYLDQENFVTLDQMGDGITEMVALIVELCLAKNKVFVLEDPEANLHPKGLKALLGMVRKSADDNQFIISTHSNIVIRELAYDTATKLFRVYRDGDDYRSPSKVEEIKRTPAARMEVLRELGYEFADFELHDGWLFLEEASAEQIIQQVLIPSFAPALAGRLRTFSAAGNSKMEASVEEFQRLVTFVHLQPVYEQRIWIRVDGDETGQQVVDRLRTKFAYLDGETCATFSERAFEYFYPKEFTKRVQQILSIPDRHDRQRAKLELLQDVLAFERQDSRRRKIAWGETASEVIDLLERIQKRVA